MPQPRRRYSQARTTGHHAHELSSTRIIRYVPAIPEDYEPLAVRFVAGAAYDPADALDLLEHLGISGQNVLERARDIRRA